MMMPTQGEIIREVWNDNLEKEFLVIQDLAEECQIVALVSKWIKRKNVSYVWFDLFAQDTEFPGVLVQQVS